MRVTSIRADFLPEAGHPPAQESQKSFIGFCVHKPFLAENSRARQIIEDAGVLAALIGLFCLGQIIMSFAP